MPESAIVEATGGEAPSCYTANLRQRRIWNLLKNSVLNAGKRHSRGDRR